MAKEQKVLIFSTAYFPFVGGAEVAIKEITDRLENVSFEMITPLYDRNLFRQETVGNVHVHRLGIGVAFVDKMYVALMGAFYARRMVKEEKVDMFWAMMVTFSGGAAFIYNILFFWKRIPLILTLQEGDSLEHIRKKRFGLIGLSWKLALIYADHVTVISTYLGELARSFGYKGTIDLVPNGVAVEKFSKAFEEDKTTYLRKKLGVAGKKVLITTSRLSKKNGVDIVIKALALLPSEVVFVVLGTGELKQELIRLARKEGVEERVIWLGLIEHDEIPLYLSISDVFIRPSRSEGMGNSFIEAMAAGIPVVATPVGGITDFVFDPAHSESPTGFLAEPEDPISVAEKISEALENGNLVTSNAKRLVEEKYTWNFVANKMGGIFNKAF